MVRVLISAVFWGAAHRGRNLFWSKRETVQPLSTVRQCLVHEIQYQNNCDAPDGSIVHTKRCGGSPITRNNIWKNTYCLKLILLQSFLSFKWYMLLTGVVCLIIDINYYFITPIRDELYVHVNDFVREWTHVS